MSGKKTVKPKTVKPGQKAPNSGQYIPVGPRGGKGGSEATMIKGKPAPPTPQKGQKWVLVDPTRNKSGVGE
jgi:hypothetical protein